MQKQEINDILKSRGWTTLDLAARWGITENWLRKLINNPLRPAHYNDAFSGLPYKDTITIKSKGKLA